MLNRAERDVIETLDIIANKFGYKLVKIKHSKEVSLNSSQS